MTSARFILPKLEATDAVQMLPAAGAPVTYMLVVGDQAVLCPVMIVPSNTTAVNVQDGGGGGVDVKEDVGENAVEMEPSGIEQQPSFKRGIMTQVEAVAIPSEDVRKIARGPPKFSSCQTDESYTLDCRVLEMLKSSGDLLHLKRRSEVKDHLAMSLGYKGRDLRRLLITSVCSVLDSIVSDNVPLDLWEAVDEAECTDERPSTVNNHTVPEELEKWCKHLVDNLHANKFDPLMNCPVCGKITTQCYVKIHMRMHSDERPHTCTVCNRHFTSLSLCKKHEKTHSTDRERPYHCSVCDHKSFTKSGLDVHMESHEASENIECPVCGKKFRNDKILQMHFTRHSSPGVYVCDGCGKTYKDNYGLQRHCKIMHEDVRKPYPCDMCDKAFTQSWTLKSHRLRHVIDRPFKCKVCGKAFTNSDALKKHSLIHNGERPHVCSICGRAFRQRTAMKTHMYTHGATRPFQCRKCLKNFIHKIYLTRHKCPFDELEINDGDTAADCDVKKNDNVETNTIDCISY